MQQAAACQREVEFSSKLLDDVAQLLQAQQDPKPLVREIERQTGRDTAPIRSFIYQKQGPMQVLIDGLPTVFNRHEVRVSAPITPAAEFVADIGVDSGAYRMLCAQFREVTCSELEAWRGLGGGRKVSLRFEPHNPQLLALLLYVGSQEPMRLRGSLHRSTTALDRMHVQLDLADTQRDLAVQALKLLVKEVQGLPHQPTE